MNPRTPSDHSATCAVCGQRFPRPQLVPSAQIQGPIAAAIRQAIPGWSAKSQICRSDLNRFRAAHVRDLILSEHGDITAIESDVLRSLREQEILAKDVDTETQEQWTLGQRLADRIAGFGGSWTFLITFGVFIGLWIAINSGLSTGQPVDPFPFILLNLLLSCLAAIQAPVIMMSQNRQEAKDRLRSQHDYQINLKAELEIRHLHEKIDHLLSHQWERLAEIQQIQMEMLDELSRRK